MKKVAFLTKSQLTPNLLNLVLPLLARKTSLNQLNLEDLKEKKTKLSDVDLLILDDSLLKDENLKNALALPHFKKIQKILLHLPETDLSTKMVSDLELTNHYAKPFLPETFIEILDTHLGQQK